MIFDGKSVISQTHVPVTYVPVGLVVWLTYRFGYWGAIISMLVTLYQSVNGTVQGFGPFVVADRNSSLLLLQTYIETVCATTLLLAATLYERRQMLQAINFSEQRFRALVENSQDMIVLLNPLGVITYTSPSAKRIMGFSKEEHEGHSIFEFVHPDDEAYLMSEFSRLISQPSAKVGASVRVRHKDGTWRWIESYGQNLLNDPVVGAIVVNYRDITERRLAEDVLKRDKKAVEKLVEERSKQLLQVQDELKQATRLADMGTLAAIVAHELRTPLGVIQMAVHNLRNKYQELATNHHLENIEKKIKEGNSIIDNLLSYSRMKSPVYQTCQVRSLLEECLSNVGNMHSDAQVEIVRDYQVGIDFKMDLDTNQIREVLLNILNNAYQALPEKKGRLEIILKLQASERLQISIKDSGIGIDQVDLDKIFLPFFTTKAKGTGLGLAICNEIVNFHHGSMNIESVKHQGTTVHLILPIRQPSVN